MPASLDNRTIAFVLTVLTTVALILGVTFRFATDLSELEMTAYVVAYLAGGVPAAWTAFRSLWEDRTLDIDLLMVTAAIAAAAVGEWMEGAILLFLFSVSNTLQLYAMERARREVEALMGLRPETAFRRRGVNGKVDEVPVGDLAVDDIVVVRPGDRMPVDGVIVNGQSSIDEATITGESMPSSKGVGDQVFEATVNMNGVLDVRVMRPSSESTVARMIALVTQAQAAKAPSERFSDWFGQRYTIVVMLGSILAFFILIGLDWSVQDATYRAATLLVAASPCAIVISVPAAILAALSASARGGVLFKGGGALEVFGSVRQFAFDKTGTLTSGEAVVTDIVALDEGRDRLMALLAGLEAHSEHHVAAAIRRSAKADGIEPVDIADVTARPSEGVVGRDGDGTLWAGNARLAEVMGADHKQEALSGLANADHTVVYVGRGPRLLGAVTVADELRPSSRGAIAALREAGITHIHMLTGDREVVARRIGRELGLKPEEVSAELLPEEKVKRIASMRKNGAVAFVGDGVNDAAALASADVGIAMGAAGSDVALQAADVALLSEDMRRLEKAYRLAQRTNQIVRQNLYFAVAAMLLLVTGTLFFDLTLPLAVVGHEGGTVLVVLNGLRLLFDPIRSD